MSLVKCSSIKDGLRQSEALVGVKDSKGREHYIRVERDFLTQVGNENYITVGVIHIDKDNVLIEFPHEPETGINRIWVPMDCLSERLIEAWT